MNYIFLITTVLASIYTFTFALWLRKNGNKAGAWGMYVLIAAGISVTLYRIIAKQ